VVFWKGGGIHSSGSHPRAGAATSEAAEAPVVAPTPGSTEEDKEGEAATPAGGLANSEAAKAAVVREVRKGAEATSWRKTR
jgi:hypothetical protein